MTFQLSISGLSSAVNTEELRGRQCVIVCWHDNHCFSAHSKCVLIQEGIVSRSKLLF